MQNLGNKLYFSQFGGERPIPDVFVAAMERSEERTSGFIPSASIPQDVKEDPNVVDAYFDPRERRTNEKVLVVVRKKEGNITLRDFRTTDQGQTLQVDSTLFYTTDTKFTRSYPSPTQDVAVRDLGNRWSIQEVAVMGTWVDGIFTPGLYQGIELSTRREDPIPSFLRTGLPLDEVQSVVEGTVAQPTLGDNDLSASERQIGQQKKLLSRLDRGPITLPANEKFVLELADLLPPRFRGLIPATRQIYAASGVAALPTLGPGELLHSEEQFSALVKIIEIVTRAGVTFPKILVDTATITEYGGGKVTITSSVANEGTYTVEEGEGIVSSKIDKLGEGHELRETVARVAANWPDRNEAHFDTRLQLIIPAVKRVVAKGSTTPGISGGVITEIRDIDGYREDRIITTQPLSVVDAYIRVLYGNTTNVDVPPHLESLVGYVDIGGGSGSYSENGSYVLHQSKGYGAIQLRGSAQASSSATPELGWIIRIPKTSNVPCIHVLLYVANGLSRANIITALSAIISGVTDWPDFRPQPITVKGVGAKLNLQVQVAASAHDSVTTDYLGVPQFDSYSRSSGQGISRDATVLTKVYNIPPTIHDTLSISNQADLWTTDNGATPIELGGTGHPLFAAHGSINGGVANADPDTGIVTCYSRGTLSIISSTSFTTGKRDYSGLGLHVHRLISEPDPVFNRTRVFAEIVDFADIIP